MLLLLVLKCNGKSPLLINVSCVFFTLIIINFDQVGKDRNGPPSWLTEYWSKYSVGKGQPGKGSNVDLAGKGSLGDLVGNSEGTVSRQNYWAPSFGNWPTHTVSKSSICPCAELFVLRKNTC